MLFSIFSLSFLLLFQSRISSKSLKYPQGGGCPLNPKDFASLHRVRVCEPHYAGFCSLKQMSSVGIPMPPVGCKSFMEDFLGPIRLVNILIFYPQYHFYS